MNGPLVSIVTPCLNPGPRLKACLQSVARQTYGRVEHIVVDGGSDDGTRTLLEQSDVHWLSEPDAGQSDAINKGWGLARGEIVGWLNADDRLGSRTVERSVNALRDRPEAGWTYGDILVLENDRRWRLRTPRRLRPHHFWVTNPVPQPGTLYARVALDRVGGKLDVNLHYAMDLDLWVRLLSAGFGGLRVPGIGAAFEVHPTSKSGAVPLADFVEEQRRVYARVGWRTAEAAFAGRAHALRLEHSDADVAALLKGSSGGGLSDIARSAAAAELFLLAAKRERTTQRSIRLLAAALRRPVGVKRLAVGADSYVSKRRFR